MEQVRKETWAAFERRLDRAGVPVRQRPEYDKCVRFHLDFCHQYGHPALAPTSLGPYLRANDPTAAGAQRHQNDHDLPANRSERNFEGGEKPAGLSVAAI